MMNRGQRLAMVLMLDREMLAQGSWCGETHLQKGTYLLQDLLDVNASYDFILYRHGPFSFELRDDLAAMQADGLLDVVTRNPRYGPSYVATDYSEKYLKRFPQTTERYAEAVAFVSKQLGSKGVSELERLATALYIQRHSEIRQSEERAAELVRLKPHIQIGDALLATEEIDAMVSSVREFRLSKS